MKDYDYYTVDEICAALASNIDEVLTRTTVIAADLVKRYRLKVEADDVFHDALERILHDTRHVPKGVPLSYSIGQVIKSICQGMVELDKEKIFKHSESIDNHSDMITAPLSDDEEDATALKWGLLEDIFKEDNSAMAFLVATRDGLNKSAIVTFVFNGDEKAYDTTRKRIVRNGQRYLKEAG